MAWVGGKKALREEILARFPLRYKRYIEVFGGAGWVLFHKPPGNDFEVFNDFNGNLVNLYRCVREQPEKLCGELRYLLNSRLDFEYMKRMLHSQAVLPDVRRAAYYYALIRYSYAAGTSTFGSQPHAMWNNFPLIDAAAGRLQKVIVENKDCVKLISQYDRPESFFYCDPPYYQADQYYEAVSADGFDHQGLAEALFGIKGKFLLSYNDCPYIRELYAGSGKFGCIVVGDQQFGVHFSVVIPLRNIGKPCRPLDHDAGAGIQLPDFRTVVVGQQKFPLDAKQRFGKPLVVKTVC